MRKSIWPFLSIVVMSLLSGCANLPITESNWTPKKPDLTQTSSITDEAAHIQGAQNVLYSIGNDSANLYVKLMIADRKTQAKILRYGLNLWLDTTGRRKEKLGITYPLSAKENKNMQDFKQQTQPQNGGMRDKAAQMEMRKHLITSMIEMDVIGFSGSEALRVPAINGSGLSASLLLDTNGVLQYKAIIPFSLMHYNPALHTGAKSKPLTIGFMTGKMEYTGSHNSDGGGGGIQGGGGGMRGNSSMGGGMSGGRGGHGGGGQSTSAEEPLDLWMQVKLAKF